MHRDMPEMRHAFSLWSPLMGTLFSAPRLRRLTQVVAGQASVQVVAFLAGILLVRHLPPQEYGYYTLAAGLVGLVGVLCDLGLGTAVLAVGGRASNGPRSYDALLADARGLHRVLAWLACVLTLPWACFVLHKQGAALGQVAVLALLGLCNGLLNARNGLLLSLVRLSGAVALQQKMDLGLNTLRLALLALAVMWWPGATMAMALNVALALAIALVLTRWLGQRVNIHSAASGTHKAALREHVLKQGPNALYYVFSSQVALWLMGLWGTAQGVAEVGALSRLAAVFGLLGMVLATLAQPYFARQHGAAELKAALLATNAFFLALTIVLTGAALLMPGALLWVLGPPYAKLHQALVWMVLSSTLTAWGATVYSLGSARGWVLPVSVAAPAGIVTTAVAAYSLDMSRAAGVFMLNSATAFVGMAVAVVYVSLQWRHYAHLQAQGAAQASTALAATPHTRP
jgi:O-antigen/teichoic acid export membrane protein